MKWLKKHCTPNTLIWIVGTSIVLAPAFLTSYDPLPSVFAYFGTQSVWAVIEKILYEQTA